MPPSRTGTRTSLPVPQLCGQAASGRPEPNEKKWKYICSQFYLLFYTHSTVYENIPQFSILKINTQISLCGQAASRKRRPNGKNNEKLIGSPIVHKYVIISINILSYK